MDVGKRIKARRKELGLSAEDVALLIGVSPATVYRYESADIMSMKTDKLLPIAEALSTTPSYLMGWIDDPTNYDSSDFASNSYGDQYKHFLDVYGGDARAAGKAYAAFKEAEKEDAMHETEPRRKLRSVARLEEIRDVTESEDKILGEFIDFLIKKRENGNT